MLGSLLIQPQMLARMQGRSAGEDLVDEVVALAQLLAMKPAALEMVFPAFEAASAAMGQAIFQRIQALSDGKTTILISHRFSTCLLYTSPSPRD